MIGQLTPDGVATAEAYSDDPDEPVFPGEEAAVARAVTSRRREFVTARRCARAALVALGVPAVAIPSGPDREPLWPDGVVGSITHCAGYRAAAVALYGTVAAIGIDAEPHAALPVGVLDAVSLPAERDHLARLHRVVPGLHWDRLLFCAKETVFKTWYPLTGQRQLGFEEAELRFTASGSFTARLLRPGPRRDGHPPLTEVTGRWQVHGGFVRVAAVVPGPDRPAAAPAVSDGTRDAADMESHLDERRTRRVI